MIPLVALAVGAVAAASAGVAAGRWIYRRVRGKQEAASRRKEDERAADLATPIALGDVVVLDGGRGAELWVARCLSLREGEGDPFLLLFEADGPAARRAILAYDPLRNEEIAVLAPRAFPEGDVMDGRRMSRPPGTIEVEVEGETTLLQLEQRKTARGSRDAVPSAEGRSDLPPAGETILVASYRGGAHGRAILARDDAGTVHRYVGRTIPFSSTSVFKNREPPPATHDKSQAGT
jgi:hypothetical protein